ncbi:MAG: ABC transporter permease [Dehalococcoidia bacterium]
MRLRARFGGKMITAVLILAACAAGVSFMVFQQGMVLAKDFYIIGVSPNAPLLDDPRFHILQVPIADSAQSLKDRRIDVYLTGAALYYRQDDRSQYAAGALKTYLEKNELARLAVDYPLNQAFPLRVEINYLQAPSKDIGSASPLTLADILNKAAKENASPSLPPGGDITEGAGSQPSPPGEAVPNATDEMVLKQLQGLQSAKLVPEFKAQFADQGEVIVPSLMNPPIPLAQVMLAFAYILPIFFISIFFTSGFLEEKLGRKLNILLSAPVTPFQIIIGKMLPYIGYSLLIVIIITLVLHGNLLLALAIFLPVILFIFAIYLGVALQYRTFKDQTFFSLVAVTGITGYLVFPAMFVGINDLSYVSPLTLAVQMYRGIDITPYQYMLSAVPMLLIFVLAVTVGSRVFNEEYLLSFRPLHVKIRDAIYYAMNKHHLAISAAVFALLLIPVVFMVEMGVIAVSFNLPKALALGFSLFICVVIEEIAKSLTVAVTIEHRLVKRWFQVFTLALVSAAFFFIGEKLLLFMSLKVISESLFTTAVFAGNMLWIPLLVHMGCTSAVCLITWKTGLKGYPLAVLIGSLLHGLYNLSLIGVFR